MGAIGDRLLAAYVHQRDNGVDGSIYKATQCDFAYNSNKIEGSTLTHDQTVALWDRDIVLGTARRNDVVEVGNHFRAFDWLLDHAMEPITQEMAKELHRILFSGSGKASNPAFPVGEYKVVENVIVGAGLPTATAHPNEVPGMMVELLSSYERGRVPGDLDQILDFLVRLERIHPFSDGNGRIGRLLMFKECLRGGACPFIITDELRPFYIRGIREWDAERGFLRDTCLTARDTFEDVYLPLAESYAGVVNLGEPISATTVLDDVLANPLYDQPVMRRCGDTQCHEDR